MTDHLFLERLRNSDTVLAKIIDGLILPDFVSTKDVFHDLMSCVIEQQIHYRSSKKIFQNLLLKSGIERLSPENFHQFEEKALQFSKISMNKQETIVRILEHCTQNEINYLSLKDEEVRDNLSSIKGIGKWTIDMLLLYTLERPNIFPYDDFHLKQIMVSLYGLNPNANLKSQMCAIAENWHPTQSLAVKYLLAWKSKK